MLTGSLTDEANVFAAGTRSSADSTAMSVARAADGIAILYERRTVHDVEGAQCGFHKRLPDPLIQKDLCWCWFSSVRMCVSA